MDMVNKALPVIPYFFNLCIKISCETVSDPLVRSNRYKAVIMPLSKFIKVLSTILCKAVSVEEPLRYANCNFDSRLWSSKYLSKWI